MSGRVPERIHVDAPAEGARRDRIERGVFDGLAAARVADRAEAALPPPPRARRVVWLAAGGAALAAAAAIAIVLGAGAGSADQPVAPAVANSAPSLVVTPVGGSSRFTVGDAVIDAGGDTSVQVATATDGATTLVLGRGSVDCDVAPREHRPPFRVQSNDVTVEVVGTRFTVTRAATGTTRVDVARGKVRVTGPGTAVHVVVAGDTWTSGATAMIDRPAPFEPAPPVEPPTVPVESTPAPNPPKPAAPSAKALFETGQKAEVHDADAAAHMYRQAANEGGDRWSALALYSLAQLDATRSHLPAAIAEADEYLRRFAKGANADDAAWLRVESLRAAGRSAEAHAAAAAYLRAFPAGTYAAAARRLAP